MKSMSLFFSVLFLCIYIPLQSQTYGSFVDKRDGKKYKTVTINGDVWMAENLAYKAQTGCWAYNNKESNAEKYGYLYNYNAAVEACPEGFKLPFSYRFNSLINNYMDENNIKPEKDDSYYDFESGKRKEYKKASEEQSYTAIMNSGFSPVKTGYRSDKGAFKKNAYGFWTSSDNEPMESGDAFPFLINGKKAYDKAVPIEYAFSVRCVAKDEYDYFKDGTALFAEEKHSEAIEAFTKSINIKPDYYITKTIDNKEVKISTYYYRAVSYYALQKFDLALADLNKAIDDKVHANGYSYFLRGVIKLMQDNTKEACSDLKIADQYGVKEAKEFIEKYCK